MSAGSVGFFDVHAICDFLRQPGTHCPCFPQTAALTPMRASSGHAPLINGGRASAYFRPQLVQFLAQLRFGLVVDLLLV